MAEDDPRTAGVGGDGSDQSSSDGGWTATGARQDPLGIGTWAEDTLPPARPSFAAHVPSSHVAPGAVPPVAGTSALAGLSYPSTDYPPPDPAAAPPAPNYQAPGYQAPGYQAPTIRRDRAGYQAADYQAPDYRAQSYQPPNGVPGYGTPTYQPPSQPIPAVKRPRPVRAGTVVAVAAITALLIGGGAGYAGSRLAQRSVQTLAPAASAPAPAPATTPTQPQSARPIAPPTPVEAAPSTLDAVKVAAAALPSAVMIRVGSGDGSIIGSGFVLDDSGLIMTNNHVVADAADGQRLRVVFSDGVVAGASLVGRSPTYDLAVIRVKTSHALVPMPIGDSNATRVGESVLAIGSPLGLPGTVTEGIVSARNRPVAVGSEGPSANAYINGTQTDASINPGNSGGPLIDAGGRAIGVNSAILTLGADREQAGNIGIGFAIPINQAMEIGRMLIADGKATYPVIGADVADSGDPAGVQLTSVTNNGPADRAGLRQGDVVTKIDGQTVSATEELIVAVRSHRPGDQVVLTYKRNGQVRDGRVTLGSREG